MEEKRKENPSTMLLENLPLSSCRQGQIDYAAAVQILPIREELMLHLALCKARKLYSWVSRLKRTCTGSIAMYYFYYSAKVHSVS